MKILKFFLAAGILLFIQFGCNRSGEIKNTRNYSINPDANDDVNKVLKYLYSLPEKSENKIISGQNCCHGNEITRCYDAYVEKLHDETGSWPGMIGVDYEYTNRFTVDQLSECNKFLIDYWNKGMAHAIWKRSGWKSFMIRIVRFMRSGMQSGTGSLQVLKNYKTRVSWYYGDLCRK